MCEQTVMTIADYRRSLGLSLEAFAALFGLKSKGQIWQIEKSNRCLPELALAIEAHSERAVDAGSINAVIAAARQGIAA